MGGNHTVDEEGEGRRDKYLTDYEFNINEIKPMSSHGSSDSSYSSSTSSDDEDLFDFPGNNDDNNDHQIGKSDQSKPKSSKNSRISFASSSGQPVYSPNRIPSSVFNSKSGTTTDWSTASTESLFSIHIGNTSFSKDQFFMLYKSGELTKLDEQIIAQKNVLPSLKELNDMAAMDENKAQGLGNPAKAVETGKIAEDDNRESKTARPEEVRGPVSNGPVTPVVGNISMEKKPAVEVQNLNLNKVSSLSEDSNISISFTFPVLAAADGGRLSSAAYGDQNNKGSPAAPLANQQQPPLPQQPPEEEEEQQRQENEITEEKEPQNPVTPQNESSRSWFSWFPCCRCS